MYNMKKSLLAMVMLVVVLVTSVAPAMADTDLPYDTYNYDYWQDIFRTPAAYVPKGSVQGVDLTFNGESLGAFKAPQDMCVAPDGSIYLADSGNNRIIVMDGAMTTVLDVISSFDNHGIADGFANPTGVAVTEDKTLYVADSNNRRIVALDSTGALVRVIEIPVQSAAVSVVGGISYTVGTHVEGMENPQKVYTDASGASWVAVNLASGSATAVTDEAGVSYTVSAATDVLKAFETTVTTDDGTVYTVEEGGNSILRTAADGTTFTYATYDPVPNKDIFLLIGRLLKGPKTSSLSKLVGVQADVDGNVYAVATKNVAKLNAKGELLYFFSGYKDAAGVQQAFGDLQAFAATEDRVYVRDDANRIIVLDMDGDLDRLIASNAITVTDAEGNVTATITGYTENGAETAFADIVGIDRIGDKLLVGQADGTVVILDANGGFITKVENDVVLAMDAQGTITDVLSTVVNGKTTERFAGLTGVTMLDGKLCVAGTNNRVIILGEDGTANHIAQNNCVKVTDRDGNVTGVISGFTFDGVEESFATIGGVEGVALNNVKQLCIADSLDRLIVLNDQLQAVRVSVDADSEVLEANYMFTPLKVSVDYAGRIYCIAQNMFEGIMVFETNGEFTGFFGTIPVTISAWDKFWRKLATKEERSKQQLYIPTEFTGIDIDEEGFVYASNVDTNGTQAVRRLNPKGEDVIRMGQSANLGGDIAINGTSTYAGASKIVDVVYRDKGVYSLLDSKRGRIFTYDHEGNLLYIFGGIGTQEGTLETPVAIEYAGDRILALDSKQNSILVYGETEYGRLINEAVALRYDGDESQAVALWEEVLRLDENNELANTGIGKAYLSAGDNEKAMEYLKRGMNRTYYSVAFKRYRNEILKENIQVILTGAVVLVAVIVVSVKVIKPKIKTKRERRA
ncbi:MAG: SMP-30/gluconolactonase/LRE family protein [Clostridia bacterium]|nr:SMP-30/gluconolactonase/LRE family protein [Clostridia bacterium]